MSQNTNYSSLNCLLEAPSKSVVCKLFNLCFSTRSGSVQVCQHVKIYDCYGIESLTTGDFKSLITAFISSLTMSIFGLNAHQIAIYAIKSLLEIDNDRATKVSIASTMMLCIPKCRPSCIQVQGILRTYLELFY